LAVLWGEKCPEALALCGRGTVSLVQASCEPQEKHERVKETKKACREIFLIKPASIKESVKSRKQRE
jgi:hypothetical protein